MGRQSARAWKVLSLETGTTGEMGPKARVCAGRGRAASRGLGAHSERPETQRDLQVLENVGAFRPPACRRHPKPAGQPDAQPNGPSRADPPGGRAVRAILGPRAAPAASSESPSLRTPKPRDRTSPSRGSEPGGAFLFFLLAILKPEKIVCPSLGPAPPASCAGAPGLRVIRCVLL